jgi:undecaprenyl pyrophosphate phosphatase UppP
MIVAITKGIIRDQHMRRQAMFVIVLAALLILFVGATFLNAWLIERPWIFLFYWGVCAWFTIGAVLLALLDLLLVRVQARDARERLRKHMFGEDKPPPPL